MLTLTESETESGENSTAVKHSIGLMEQWNTVLVSVITTTTTKTKTDDGFDTDSQRDIKLLTSTGTEIVAITDAKDSQMNNAWFIEDLICVNGKVYRIAEDGTVAAAFDWSDLRGEPEIEAKVGNFYLGEAYDGIAVYDASLNLVATYHVPSYADKNDASFWELSNGNVLIQYSVLQDIMAEDYTYIENMSKYNLYSFLIDAERGKVKELDLDYVVVDNYYEEPGEDSWFFNEKVENVAWVAYIEDQRIDVSGAAIKMVSLSNKGKIQGVIDDLIPNMVNESLELVATNRWVVRNLVGQAFLLNEAGEVLGEVTGLDDDEMTANFFVLNNKIYDWDLNVKCDLNEQKIEGDYRIMNHSVQFETEDGEIKLYVNGEVKTIMDKATAEAGKRQFVSLSGALYIIIDTATEGTTKYEVYNDAGTLLTTVDNATFNANCIIHTADSNNAVLIVGTDKDTKPVYYRVG